MHRFATWARITIAVALCLGAPSVAAHAEGKSPYGVVLAEDTTLLGLHVDRAYLGGWMDASFQDSTLDEDGSNFAVNHLNGILDLRFEDRWQLFAEAEIEYRPELATLERESELELEQMYLRATLTDTWNLRAGIFSTPFGYWTPVHWTINTDTVVPPLAESRRIVPEQQLGVRLAGDHFFRPAPGWDLRLQGSLFGGYAPESASLDRRRGLTGGGDLRLGLEGRGFVGASLYTQEAEGDRSRRDRELSAVLYGELDLPASFTLRGEYVFHRGARIDGADRRRDFFYAKLRWTHGRWSVNYRFERGEDVELGPSAVQRIHRFTLGYSPVPRVRLRGEVAEHRVDRGRVGDFRSVALWVGVFF